MILRRVTEHVKAQNWLAVGIDFFVVVAGIFIGLQVTEWNQQQANQREGIYYLDFLATQLESGLPEAAEEIERSEKYANATREAGRLLLKDSWEEDDVQSFQRNHAAAFQFWGPEQQPAALRRLIDGGKLDFIESKEIQAAILEFESLYVDAIQQTRTSYNYSLPLTLQIMNGIRYREFGVASTLEELQANELILSGLRGKYIFQDVQLDVLKNIHTASESLAATIRQYLESIN